MTATDLTKAIKEHARQLGFTLAGVCPAVEPTGITRFHEWLERGYAGEMQYLANREPAYRHPSSVLEGVRSIVMLAMNYRTTEPRLPQPGEGRVSRYAWGQDYHDLIRNRLNELAAWFNTVETGQQARGVVDSAPLMEREFAQLASLGWIGKNTLLLNRQQGSWFFLAALLTTAELTYDTPHETDHCGTCTACLDACPTNAFPQPYVLDARKCISYLTIEHRSAIATELRGGVGDWLFGCDICQDVCPWNHRAPLSQETAFAPVEAMNPVNLASLFSLDDAAFRARFRDSPIWRAKRRGLLRNAAIALGNQRHLAAMAELRIGLHDEEPLVRGASAWALGKLGSQPASRLLVERQSIETNLQVLAELDAAISATCSSLP